MGASRRIRRRLTSKQRPTAGTRAVDDVSPQVKEILHEALSATEPYWNVKLVHHDPDGPCEVCDHEQPDRPTNDPHADYGYTVGLHDRYRLPELHCAAVPETTIADGFSLGYRTVGEILNTVAARTIAGELQSGSTFELTATRHDHRFHLNFHLGPPGERDAVSAYHADPAAEVIPIRWSVVDVDCLHRGRR